MTILKLILVEPEHDLYQLASVCKLQSDREYCMLVLHKCMFRHIISSLYENDLQNQCTVFRCYADTTVLNLPGLGGMRSSQVQYLPEG